MVKTSVFVDIGELVRVKIEFQDPDTKQFFDPDNVYFEWVAQEVGVTTLWTYGVDPSLIKTSLGHYAAFIDTSTVSGEYFYRAYATGVGQSAEIGSFNVRPNPVVNNPATVTTTDGNDITPFQDSFTADGSSSTVTLTYTPINNSLHVYINGFFQPYYTRSGRVITFGVMPSSGDLITVVYFRSNN